MNRKSCKKKILDASRRIAERFDPDKIILFGSWAWGTPGPDSDVDFLVIKATGDTRGYARQIDGFLFPRPFPFDVIVCKPGEIERRMGEGDPFASEIHEKGKTLYAKAS